MHFDTTKNQKGGEWGEVIVKMTELAEGLEECAAKREQETWGTCPDDDDEEEITEISDVRLRRKLAYEQFVDACCHRTRYMNLTYRSLRNLERALRSSNSFIIIIIITRVRRGRGGCIDERSSCDSQGRV